MFGLNLISFNYVLGVVILYLCDMIGKERKIHLSKGKKEPKYTYMYVMS